MSPVPSLPSEMWLSIMCHLPPSSLRAFGSVCRLFDALLVDHRHKLAKETVCVAVSTADCGRRTLTYSQRYHYPGRAPVTYRTCECTIDEDVVSYAVRGRAMSRDEAATAGCEGVRLFQRQSRQDPTDTLRDMLIQAHSTANVALFQMSRPSAAELAMLIDLYEHHSVPYPERIEIASQKSADLLPALFDSLRVDSVKHLNVIVTQPGVRIPDAVFSSPTFLALKSLTIGSAVQVWQCNNWTQLPLSDASFSNMSAEYAILMGGSRVSSAAVNTLIKSWCEGKRKVTRLHVGLAEGAVEESLFAGLCSYRLSNPDGITRFVSKGRVLQAHVHTHSYTGRLEVQLSEAEAWEMPRLLNQTRF